MPGSSVHGKLRVRIEGSITALATPFTAAGALDLAAWKRLLDQQLAAGTQALVVAGSTGEAAALEDAEFETILRAAVEQVGGRIPVLAGTGMSSTARTVAQTRRAQACGADAALVVTPPYVRPTQTGLLVHYAHVAAQGGLPVVLYNVPTRTGCDLLPETVAQLRVHPQIVGIKEAVPTLSRIQALVALKDADFSVLSGDDGSAASSMLAGADGVVSVASNIVPASFRRLCELARGGDREAAAALVEKLQGLFGFLALEPNPITIKALLAESGIGSGLRLPLLPLSAQHGRAAVAMARDCTALEAASRAALTPTLAA